MYKFECRLIEFDDGIGCELLVLKYVDIAPEGGNLAIPKVPEVDPVAVIQLTRLAHAIFLNDLLFFFISISTEYSSLCCLARLTDP